YEKIAPIPKAPDDLPLDEEASFSVLEFEDDFDVYEFDLTFADGETVKYIEIDAIDDDEPELPEMGIFTIVECEGGELSDLCNTHTVLVSDNDEHGHSVVGFMVKGLRVDRSSDTAYVKVIRRGDTSYNITVDYETVDGSAQAGKDYAAASGSVALVGSIDEIEIPIDLIENDETGVRTFTVKLSNIKGGGLDDLCEMGLDEMTVIISGENTSDGESGKNLATVLASSDGEDLTSRVEVEDKALIGESTTLNWNYEGSEVSEELKGEYTIHPATRSHLAWAGLTFERSSISSDYNSGEYWCDREMMVGIDHIALPNSSSGGVNTMRYLEGMEPEVEEMYYIDGEPPEKASTSGSYMYGQVEGAYKEWVVDPVTNKGHYEETPLEYYQLSSNYASSAGMSIEHAGLLFKDFHFAFKIENYGKKGKSSYYYPLIWFDYNGRYFDSRSEQSYGIGDGVKLNVYSADVYTVGWVLYFKNNVYVPTDGATWSYSSGGQQWCIDHNEGVWDPGSEHDMGIRLYSTGRSAVSQLFFEDTDFSFGIDFENIDQYDQSYTPRDTAEIADSQTIVDVLNFNFGRRAFAYKNGTINDYGIEQEDPMVLPVVIYTANDENEVQSGWSPIDISTEYGEALYERLAPEVTIAKKRGGVTVFGSLYVGSTLVLDCGKQAGYTVPDKGIYLTRSDGKVVAYGKPVTEEGKENVWELTFLWSDMTEEDLSDTYQINVIYERTQTLSIDISPSVPRLDGLNIDPNSVPGAWKDFFGYDEETGKCSKKITIEYGTVNTGHAAETVGEVSGYTDTGDPVYREYVDYTDFSTAVQELSRDDFTEGAIAGVFDSTSPIRNAQAICFGQDEKDTILFNNHSYKGNEFIPLDSDDVASSNLIFYFYDSEYSDAMSTMVANFDHAELYYDGEGDGIISGTFLNGIFVPSGEDVYIGQIKGEHFEAEFSPFIDEDGHTHQYFIKAIYSMRPRALEKPKGSVGDQQAQVFPVFLSAVTDPDEEDDLTKEQKAYRYIDGENVDGHPMFGKEATALSYIDIPLGGDTSKVRRYSVTRGIYDSSGEKLIDSENTTEYFWEPYYIGSLKVGFEYPDPIYDDDNITQKTVLYAGEVSVHDEETDRNYHSEEGVRRLNAYLGAFAGRSTFGICVQVQQKEYEDIKTLSEIAPESINIAVVSSVPNASSVVHFESGENKDETQGQTPDGTGFNEFGGDIGIDLPSLEFGIGDYATLILDGNQIGLTVGLPLFKAESTSYNTDNTTTNADGSKVESYKEDGADVKKTTKADGSVETEKVSTSVDPDENIKTVTKQVETVDKDGNKTYHNETTTYKTEEGKPDKPLSTVTDTNAPNTEEDKSNGFAEANGQMVTLGKFISSVAKRAAGQQGTVKEFMKGAFEDDTFKQAKNGKSTSKKLSFSLSVQIALTFEYNPVYNTHVFKEGALSASVSFEFTLQHRFTPVPIVYVYVKTGIEVEIGVGMGMIYSLEEADAITAFEAGDLKSLETKNGQLIFKLDDDYSGFHATFHGKLYMEVFDHMPKDGDEALTAGIISSSGSMKEMLLTQYDSDLYIKLTSIGDKVTMMSIKPIMKSSKVYFNGAFITPSISIEAGVGIGIELLKFELYVKTNLAITATFGQYIPEEDAYEPAYMSEFNWNISVGFNVVLLFINYSMDLVAFSVEGEQDGTSGDYTWVITASSANGMKELWTETRYTDAHGNPISGPRSGMRAIGADGEKQSPKANGNGLIKISSPTDITATQKINAVRTSVEELREIMKGDLEEMRSFPATGTKDFELSGYGVSGDARVLATGLTTGYSYKLFQAEDENYIIYPRMIDKVPQLVMSKVIMVGDLSIGTGLQNPVTATAEEPYIVLDGDGLADYDYSVGVDGSTVTAVWTTDGENGIVTKRASLVLGESTGFSEAKVLTADDGVYKYLPDQTGNISVYAESSGSEGERKAAKLAYRSYLIAKNPKLVGEDYDLLEDGDTNNPILVSAVFSYVTATQMIDMQGTSTVLSAVISSGDKDEVKTAVINGETIENIETAVLGGRTLIAYTTSKTAYFDSASGKTVAAEDMNANTERALIRRLYIRELTADGFAKAKLIQEVVDFESCGADNLDTARLKDGVYVNNALYGEGEADPHYANLKFLTASLDLDEDPETFMLFEMGGNTYILRQSAILSLLSGSNAQVSLTPVFESTQGTDVTIGSDGKKLAVVYTAAMPNTSNNAIWIAWWDSGEGTWGEANVLAMRHLQIYEDSIMYEMSPEETELAYLGKIKTPGGNEGSMSRLYFSDLQMSTREVEEGGQIRQELMVLTEGSMIELQDFEYENVGGETIQTVIPKRVQSEENEEYTVEVPPSVGFYAIAFGEGTQALGEAALGFANYDFTSGHELVGEVSFRNVGTAAIRAGKSNPVTVILSVTRPGEGSQELAKWLLSESIPAGGKARLTFTTDALTHDLPTGSKFSLYLTEDSEYIENIYHGEAFNTNMASLFEVAEKAELAFSGFDAQLRKIDGEYAIVYVEGSVLNVGNKDADEVFIQFTYDKGKEDENGVRYIPIDLEGNTLKTGKP
ncbi:MAG: hypothetical protein J5528_03630, partial [Firmicutes bacterium]|nr:hypothetical protein [Bacillota bacterium]